MADEIKPCDSPDFHVVCRLEAERLRSELALERAKAIRLRRALDAALESE